MDFLERVLALAPGSRVLDVPCGNGRHCLELARRGHRPMGVDISEDFLSEARSCSAQEALDVSWVSADMAALPPMEPVDAACCMGNSFGYLPGDAMHAFLASLSAALRPGGRFVLESGAVAESLLPDWQEERAFELGDMRMEVQNLYHVDESCMETRYRFLRGPACEEKTSFHWVYTVAELRRMLAGHGLSATDAFASTDGAPYQVGAPVLYLVAQR